MKEVFDYGTGVPYTHEDLEVLFRGKVEKRKEEPTTCSSCTWFDAASGELCLGPATCVKWAKCGKCCSLDGRASLVEFESCPHFKVDLIMAQ